MRPGILFDSSVYISALRQGQSSILALRQAGRAGDAQPHPLWLSAVVLEELCAGALDAKARKVFARLERDFEKIERVLVPTQKDWSLAGFTLSHIGNKYGFELIGRARMTNDALIAISAARQGLIILTKNADDYRLISQFRHVEWEKI